MDIQSFNAAQSDSEQEVCVFLEEQINKRLPDATAKIWHKHPVWFLDDNPIVGYAKLKAGIRLMFWSGASFKEDGLTPGTGKFKDATITYTQVDQIDLKDLRRWLDKSVEIQWDYKNVVKRKGKLIRLS